MSSTIIKEPRSPLEQDQHSDTANSCAMLQTQDRYIIRCTTTGYYAYFEPTRQLLTSLFGQQVTAKVELSFSTSHLLELLILRADTIVAREDILAYAWPDRVVTQNSLNQAISNLREHLGDDLTKEIIQTMPRRGYQLNSRFLISLKEWSALQDSSDSTPTVASPDPRTVTERSRGVIQHRRLFLLLLITLLFGTLIWRINFTLLLQPGPIFSSLQIDNQYFLYTAPSQEQLLALQADTTSLRARLLSLPEPPRNLLFNRMHNFLDVICINKDNKVSSILLHESQLPTITDHQLMACAK
ncbi:transcriptional regulator [Pseudomonas sp. 6D_7.1_Bac1]|uniref:winged helix-turn-helix domain-containing protein n=1 Tax=Pseudomonas sp. 6D_7.1_Bac1 TaxID=2971615 RepID=UPI0021C8CA36|nr:winged helix-turn-helix domain-containing protein [Pseudomonas sp. 6D_7.1_Bac1]MCU1750248.1 winged helix-turn-helix domain-containing protein [Pseudomonas sp. 6D_7.1_Bac1]